VRAVAGLPGTDYVAPPKEAPKRAPLIVPPCGAVARLRPDGASTASTSCRSSRGPRPPVERTFFWKADGGDRRQRVVRKGKWKYLEYGADAPIHFLFDLDEDVADRRNLWYEHLEIAAELEKLLERWEKEVKPAGGRLPSRGV